MEEDIKIENIKDGCKISVPIISNQELDDFNNILDIETEYEKLIKKVSEQVYKEKECILLQQIIKKQEQTIENLIARNKELEELKKLDNDLEKSIIQIVQRDYIPKSKVREKIEELKEILKNNLYITFEHYGAPENCLKNKIEILQEILQEGDK